jgi:Uma2 family endonuclease
MGMAAIPPSVTTLDEFLALPEDSSYREELLDGVYVVSPNPTLRHQRAVMAMYHRLIPALERHPELLLFPLPGDIVLGPRTVVVPDLFVVPKPPSAYVHWRELARPILAIEVVSPRTAGRDRGIKRRLYQESEVPEYWIVDLDSRLVERWRPEDQRPEILSEILVWQVAEDAEAFGLDLAEFFAEVLDR